MSNQPRRPGTRVDHYELLDHLGDGGQAEVHWAKDVRDGSEVVIKFPLAHTLDHPVLAARWRREAALTEGLYYARIVCRLDAGERHSEPFIVLEYASGGSLRGWLSAPGDPLPIGQAVIWGRQLAEALVYLHGHGIVHRDLKPDNVLVTSDLAIKLGDFGAAVSLRSHLPGQPRHHLLSLPQPPEGTAGYLSPEQITGQHSDERSDIYSWGIVMYELLTGQLPFPGPDPWASMEAHLRDRPPPVREVRPDVPQALAAVVMMAMRRHPAHRYARAEDLVADLNRLDSLGPTSFDLGPEEPITTPVGGAELKALLRLILVAMAGFVAFVTVAIVLTTLLR